MKVLVIGGGGREHALAWRLSKEARIATVFVAPGNAGTAAETKVRNIDIGAGDTEALLAFAREEAIDLTIVGPEDPLVAGLVDQFAAAGLPCFGPSAAAARLEGSKAFSKDFMARHGIPTAAYDTFDELAAAERWIRAHAGPLVVKADGLAAGKGVIVCEDADAACEAARAMLSKQRFGPAGERIVIEEFLAGEEASFIAMVDGQHILPLASSQDHKARDNGDRGPNTGGMGAYSPAPVVDSAVHERIMAEVMRPAVAGLAEEGTPYSGFLYAGLMVAPDGRVKVLEFNCRFGDPETQPIMMRLRTPLSELCEAALAGRLDRQTLQWDPRVALGVVMAAGGYPGPCASGHAITGLPEEQEDLKVFHAGTRSVDGRVVTSGGRVLCVVGLGESVASASDRAYAATRSIHWPDCYFRDDIGHRALTREQSLPA